MKVQEETMEVQEECVLNYHGLPLTVLLCFLFTANNILEFQHLTKNIFIIFSFKFFKKLPEILKYHFISLISL